MFASARRVLLVAASASSSGSSGSGSGGRTRDRLPRGDAVVRLLYGKHKHVVHKTSARKPSLATTLLHTPNHELAAAVRRAAAMRMLTRADILQLLRAHRALRRDDRSDTVVRALRAAGVPLTTQHYAVLMAHANDSGNSAKALRYWAAAVREGKTTPTPTTLAAAPDKGSITATTAAATAHETTATSTATTTTSSSRTTAVVAAANATDHVTTMASPRAILTLHGAVLAAYRNAGQWQAAVAHCEALWDDQYTLDAHALHTVLNACRRYGSWRVGLSVFQRAVAAGTRPSSVVYLELLRLLAQSRLRQRWRYGVAVLTSLHGKVDVTAGHYNAVLATLRASTHDDDNGDNNKHSKHKHSKHNKHKHSTRDDDGDEEERYAVGMHLFDDMQARGVQPSNDTLTSLLQLRPRDVAHCVRCIAHAHTLGVAVTDTMYGALLACLFAAQRADEAVAFAEREYRRDVDDAGDAVSTTLPLSTALLDALLRYRDAAAAQLVYERFEEALADVVAATTAGLGSSGARSQRWLVQGRVAVVDHSVVLSPQLQSLVAHYDAVFVPFVAVRVLVRRASHAAAQTRYAAHVTHVLSDLQRALQTPSWRCVRVLPLAHQLLAHTYLAHDSATTTTAAAMTRQADLQQLRDEAAASAADAAAAAVTTTKTTTTQTTTRSLAERLLSSIPDDNDDRTTTTTTTTADSSIDDHDNNGDVAAPALVIRAAPHTPLHGVLAPIAAASPHASAHDGSSDTSSKTAAAGTRAAAAVNAAVAAAAEASPVLSLSECVLAVAAMLKVLNRDASVHVVSARDAQLRAVATWNARQQRPQAQATARALLTAVRYPDELHRKAPPASVDEQQRARAACL